MATGRVGASNLSATTWTTVYTVPGGTVFTGTVNFCNRNSTPITIRLGFGTGSSASNGEFVEYELTLSGYGTAGSVYERTGIVLEAGMKVLAYSSATNTDVVVMGYEE